MHTLFPVHVHVQTHIYTYNQSEQNLLVLQQRAQLFEAEAAVKTAEILQNKALNLAEVEANFAVSQAKYDTISFNL
jgi:hypothetical protein